MFMPTFSSQITLKVFLYTYSRIFHFWLCEDPYDDHTWSKCAANGQVHVVFILHERVFWWLMKIDCVRFCVVSFGHMNIVYVPGVKRPGRVADHALHLLLSLRKRAALTSEPPMPLWHVEGHFMLTSRGREDYCRLILIKSRQYLDVYFWLYCLET